MKHWKLQISIDTRWDIEIFFKWIKQNIVVKTLWEFSKNAVSIHLWAAIITYLLIAKIKYKNKSPYSITGMATLIRISALEKVNLKRAYNEARLSSISYSICQRTRRNGHLVG
ncbi:hypothetical protein HMPREF0973_01845 [Prevotella veroralis F0319]|uniref:Transposase IS4-like domain-containing protein n=1 Tax=Prevotella veroralis F0319 TaxID=649761 RepID=C9MQE5_9BACT|nr:hypothetical protein HMPREF0973_01845 [Prevotella veroralis F0319]